METKPLSKEKVLVEQDAYGNHGGYVVYPETEAEISQLLKEAYDQNKKVAIVGGGTKRGLGGIEENYDLTLSTKNYKGIVEHIAGDMTLTVKPGTTIQEIQDYLREYKQMASLDPAWPSSATIGGVIAANDSGPKRLKYGSARDLVIGLKVIYPDGMVIRTGGKVVKNVAGYDMNKLFIGSMGTLGVISEITIKLRPLPKSESLVRLSFLEGELTQVKAFANQIQDSLMEPVTLELINPTLSKRLFEDERYSLLIQFEDVEKSVKYQEKWVQDHKPESVSITILTEREAQAFWKNFANMKPNSLQAARQQPFSEVTLKMGSKNMDAIDVINESQVLQGPNQIHIEAHGGIGHGISYATISGEREDIKASIYHLRTLLEKRGGYLTITHAPQTLRQEVSVWGEAPSYFFLLKGMKEKVDPKHILNVKRFVGGI